MPGDVLSGIINQIKDSQVLIGFNDGSLLSAHLTGDANVSKGDNITFLVKNISDNQISLKVVSVGEQQNMFIDKALELPDYTLQMKIQPCLRNCYHLICQ